MADATQDRMLGAILGFAIGDAFGMPVFGLSAQTINDVYGRVTSYLPRKFADGAEVLAGEITDDTEIALCIVESITAAQGEIDSENIAIRMAWLARGDSSRWLHPTTQMAIGGLSEEHGYSMPLIDDELVGADVLARALPIGLLHSMGKYDRQRLIEDAEHVTRITHGSPVSLSVVATAAQIVALTVRGGTAIEDVIQSVLDELPDGDVKRALKGEPDGCSEPARVLTEAIALATSAESFGQILSDAVAMGGAADSRAALAAALFAGHEGSQVIPQKLIDELESRIYVSLAVPWFYRTVAKRNGRAIDLRVQRDQF
ncbi:MAG TPA: ADP-ribosylglycohydrolase family protein [Thermomicrobiales bacterium]|nr:ADP-ribosylglycohydrolase family protein [Thermomicrobiales bacterium]